MDNSGKTELNYCYNCMTRLDSGQIICPECGYDNSVNHNPPDTLASGTILAGKYLVGKILGQGGFGITYLGYDIGLKKRVAIKEYYPRLVCSRVNGTNRVTGISSLSHPEDFRNGIEEFGKEAETLANISSPNIVRVLNTFRENGTAYIIMEFADGISLSKEVMDRGGRLPWQRVLELFRDLIPELGKIHKRRLIHRDIKPDNLQIVKDENGEERLVLLDFGTARGFESAEVSQTYTAMLTPGYAPLEQYSRKSKQGPYTDIYALCATMYAVITGNIPPGASERSLGDAKLCSINEQGLNVPERVEEAILHGLEVQREDRPQSMGNLYTELYGAGTNPIPDDPDELVYQAGMKMMSAGSREGYEKALKLFEQIPGWKDADDMAAFCRRKTQGEAQTIKKESVSNPPESKSEPKNWLVILLISMLIGGMIYFTWSTKKERVSIQQTQTVFYLLQTESTEAADSVKPTSMEIPVSGIIPTDTQAPEPTATMMPTRSPISVGNIVTIGHYEQDGNLNNGAEEIEWQVLAVEDDRALVISKYGLDTKRYNEERKSVTWETCTLRAWLNKEFYNSVFNEKEKGLIREIILSNPDNAKYGTNGGNDTTDRIFLLSIEEAEQYFANDEARQCQLTAYAKNNGAFISEKYTDMTWWWLRSPGLSDSIAAGVDPDGGIRRYGDPASSTADVVRPAFWLDL